MSKFRKGDFVIVLGRKIGLVIGIFFTWDQDILEDTLTYTIDIQGEIYYAIESEIELWNNKQSYGT